MLGRFIAGFCELNRLKKPTKNWRTTYRVVPAHNSWILRAYFRSPEVPKSTQKHGDTIKISKSHVLTNQVSVFGEISIQQRKLLFNADTGEIVNSSVVWYTANNHCELGSNAVHEFDIEDVEPGENAGFISLASIAKKTFLLGNLFGN